MFDMLKYSSFCTLSDFIHGPFLEGSKLNQVLELVSYLIYVIIFVKLIIKGIYPIAFNAD